MTKYIIGIDEVGRGSSAGPVTVTALAIPSSCKLKIPTPSIKFYRKGRDSDRRVGVANYKLPLRDSKKLSSKQREEWFTYLKNNQKIIYATAHIQPSVVDRINISQAANLAASRALARLVTCNKRHATCKKIKIFLDGGLFIRPIPKKLVTCNLSLVTVVRGDEKIKAISLASIVAKVTRDRLMVRLHKKYPKYRFDIHKGYGTKKHMAAVRRFGPSEKHRLTFM
ncbi:MAG: ribonuclease HII [bacterium]|nr:ribonuclease HII [bacterium]